MLAISGWPFVVGIVLFSGSLYALALTGVATLGAITPIGGLAFLLAVPVIAADPAKAKPGIEKSSFGKLDDGKAKFSFARLGDSEEVSMARLRFWLERLMEARRAKRDARLFARIVDEREARRMTLDTAG